jgi:hypothetical protein
MIKKILLAVVVILIIIQFFRPKKNINEGPQANNIETKFAMPADVKTVLQKACYDCHSNNTTYPWYNNIQPVAFWLSLHVNEGKRKLNFDEFTNLPLYRQYKKLDEITEQMKESEMPLSSYTWIHKNAILTDAEKQAANTWVTSSRAAMEAAYPKDSLQRPKGQEPPKKD